MLKNENLLTFFGGTIATADFGAMDTCGRSFSPLMDLLRACIERIMLVMLATASADAPGSQLGSERNMIATNG